MTTETQNRGGKPLQRVSEADKNKDKKKFYRDNLDFLIRGATFDNMGRGDKGAIFGSNKERNKKMLYEVYNNQIPLEWFGHITNPYGTDKPEYQRWPAKIRPTTILRTNVDLFISEYPKRPFSYFVSNLGEDSYNAYTDGLNDIINKTLQRKFIQLAQQELAAQGQSMGHTAESVAQMDIPTPDEIATAYKASYQDKLAIIGQKKLKRAIRETELRRKLLKMFKDWLIAGEAISFKGLRNGVIEYKRFSPLNVDWDKSEDVDFIEDGEWVVSRSMPTLSDVVDMFYDELKDKDYDELEKKNYGSPGAFYSHLQGLYLNKDSKGDRIPLYHCVWKGKKLLKKVTSTDPMTGGEYIDYLDEDYVKEEGEKVEDLWVNCVYEGYRAGDKTYLSMGELKNQVSGMNNFSTCKLPYNGKCFSDVHAQNTSVLEIGLPFQIMYIIVTRALEMTMAKSKGKIVLLDKNVIPKGAGWDEDKFFYYADALGWGLINRNQMGVDKSFNQYQVVDLTLYDSIKQLIELQQHIKQEWDDVMGVSRQRKSETYASDTASGNNQALLQSNVMTDHIFMGFEQLVERDLQGLLDLTKFSDLEGTRRLYNASEFETDLIDADPNTYPSADLGVFITDASVEGSIFRRLEGYTQAMIQNGTKASTVIEMVTAENVATLKAVIRKAEEAESQAAQANAESEQEHEQQLEEIRQRYAEIEHDFKLEEINTEWDRRDNNEYIKGQFQIDSGKEGSLDKDNDGIPDATEIQKNKIEQERIASSERIASQQIADKQRDRNQQSAIHLVDTKVKLRDQDIKLQQTKIQAAAAARKAAQAAKKKKTS